MNKNSNEDICSICGIHFDDIGSFTQDKETKQFICSNCHLKKYRKNYKEEFSEEEIDFSIDLGLSEIFKFTQLEDLKQSFYVQYLRYCGCVDSELGDDIMKVMNAMYDDFNYISDIVEETNFEYNYVLAILVILDRVGSFNMYPWYNSRLIEHGTSIRGSWLEPRGKLVVERYRIIENKIKEMSKNERKHK